MQTEENPSIETIEHWHKDPRNWKWGIFYFNKADKRIFPRKRYGYFGCTINFTNPMSIIINFSIVIAIVLIAIYFKTH